MRQPGKILAVGRNYADHAAELGLDVTQTPRVFFKPPTALIASGDAIVLPPQSQQVEHEAELAVVIGRPMRNVSAAKALAYVAGYCCANDVTARDIQHAQQMPDYAKSFDTFCPLGPMVPADGIDPADVLVECLVNGVVRQSQNTSTMLTPVAELLAYCSAAMTLEPGDILLTGTPAGVGPLVAGDEVTVRISGVGSLTNPVVS